MNFDFAKMHQQPVVIAGPCMAESPELLAAVAEPLTKLASELHFTLVFKASFDKANRTAVDSYRGPGLEQGMTWLAKIKEKYGCFITTDIHETQQVARAAEVADLLQIPAFLCRQTDLIAAAVETGRAVSVKKGQFLAPESCRHIVGKAKAVSEKRGKKLNLALIERGSSFGYNNLVVDMRGLKTMADLGAPVIFDITHSTQQPSGEATTAGLRSCAPLLARAAAATGYLSGVFLEVHQNPALAKSDAATQLSIEQAKSLLSQVVPILRESRTWVNIDERFS